MFGIKRWSWLSWRCRYESLLRPSKRRTASAVHPERIRQPCPRQGDKHAARSCARTGRRTGSSFNTSSELQKERVRSCDVETETEKDMHAADICPADALLC